MHMLTAAYCNARAHWPVLYSTRTIHFISMLTAGFTDTLTQQKTDYTQEGIPEEYEVIYVGCCPSEIDIMEQEVGDLI